MVGIPRFLIHVIEPDAVANFFDHLGVLRRVSFAVDQSALSIAAGAYAKALPECASERFVALEAAGERDVQYRIITR